MGVIKNGDEYEFFTSDGAFHPRQLWQGHWIGNSNYGSVVTTLGTPDEPLGKGSQRDVSIMPNPDCGMNPNYTSYGYYSWWSGVSRAARDGRSGQSDRGLSR